MKLDVNRSRLYVVLFATMISGAFTGGIMALHQATRGTVEANQRLLRDRALVDLFALGDAEKLADEQVRQLKNRRILETVINEGTDSQLPLLVAFREDLPEGTADRSNVDIRDGRNIVGYAFPIRGVGFWAPIEGYLAVSPDLKRTIGITFLAHSETPGLGGRITENDFRDQFRDTPARAGRDVTLPEDGGPALRVERADLGKPGDRRHVDAITGATGTSTAVGRFINADLRRFRQAAAAAGLTGPGTSSEPS